MPSISSAHVIRLLTQSGWVLVSVKGSHHQLTHPDRGGRVTVPHPKKDLGVGLLKSIERQSGVKIL